MFTALLLSLAIAQPPCPNGQCQRPAPAAVVALQYEWRVIPGAPEQRALYQGSIQLGSFSFQSRTYRPLLRGGSWGKISTPPTRPPAEAVPPAPVTQAPVEPLNFGINLKAFDESSECNPICKNGSPCSFDEGLQALYAGPDFPNDSDKLHVTSIGSPEHNDTVKRSLVEAGLLAKVSYQAYPPNSPMIQCGFPAQGDHVVLQDKDNFALHMQEGAANVVGAVRKARPDFDPKKVPDLNVPPVIPGIDFPEYVESVYHMLPPIGWLGVGLLLYFLYNRYQKAKKTP